MPPEAPIDREKTKRSNLLGQKDLINEWSKFSHLVSRRQMTAQLLSSILLYTANLLSGSLWPLTFQSKTLQSESQVGVLSINSHIKSFAVCQA